MHGTLGWTPQTYRKYPNLLSSPPSKGALNDRHACMFCLFLWGCLGISEMDNKPFSFDKKFIVISHRFVKDGMKYSTTMQRCRSQNLSSSSTTTPSTTPTRSTTFSKTFRQRYWIEVVTLMLSDLPWLDGQLGTSGQDGMTIGKDFSQIWNIWTSHQLILQC